MVPPEVDLGNNEKPRERILRAGSATVASGAELLAILIGTGVQGCDALELSHRLINAFGSVEALVRSDLNTLKATICAYNKAHPTHKIVGLGDVKLLTLVAAFELARRGCVEQREMTKPILTSEAAVQFFRVATGANALQEMFWVLPLDARRRPLAAPQMVAKGTVNNVAVHLRDIFSLAVRWNAHSIIVAHNHPSGCPAPSKLDVLLTESLRKGAELMGIPMRDHIVFTDDEYYSFTDQTAF